MNSTQDFCENDINQTVLAGQARRSEDWTLQLTFPDKLLVVLFQRHASAVQCADVEGVQRIALYRTAVYSGVAYFQFPDERTFLKTFDLFFKQFISFDVYSSFAMKQIFI